MSSIRSSEEFTYSIDKLEREEEHLHGSYSNLDMSASLPVSEQRPRPRHNEPEIIDSLPRDYKKMFIGNGSEEIKRQDSEGSFGKQLHH